MFSLWETELYQFFLVESKEQEARKYKYAKDGDDYTFVIRNGTQSKSVSK